LCAAVGETIHEVSPEHEDSIAQMCQQLTQGLSAMSSNDPFNNGPAPGASANHGHMPGHLVHQASLPVSSTLSQPHVFTRQHTLPASTGEQVLSDHHPMHNDTQA
jgi:hypothetical protein